MHVGLLNLFGSIVKRVGGVLLGRYRYLHFGCQHASVRAFDSFGCDFKYFYNQVHKNECVCPIPKLGFVPVCSFISLYPELKE